MHWIQTTPFSFLIQLSLKIMNSFTWCTFCYTNRNMADGEVADGGVRRRGCTFQKKDFFPEESFKNWGSYRRSVMETPFHFKDRVLKRSSDHAEIVDVKARSGNEMKKTLNWWDLMWLVQEYLCLPDLRLRRKLVRQWCCRLSSPVSPLCYGVLLQRVRHWNSDCRY